MRMRGGGFLDGGRMAVALAALGVSSTAVAALALAWPSGPPAGWLGLAVSHEARAHALVAPVAGQPSASDLALARQETLASLRQGPANPTAWLRLAFIDARGPGGLSAEGEQALVRSYAVAPYGPDDTPWRLVFAFDHWPRLDRSTRLLVLDELEVAMNRRHPGVRGLPDRISDPAGRLAATLTTQDVANRMRRAREDAAGRS